MRQAIYRAAKAGDWAAKHKFYIGGHDDVKGEYSDMLSRAKFCLVAPGEPEERSRVVTSRHLGQSRAGSGRAKLGMVPICCSRTHCGAHVAPRLTVCSARR